MVQDIKIDRIGNEYLVIVINGNSHTLKLAVKSLRISGSDGLQEWKLEKLPVYCNIVDLRGRLDIEDVKGNLIYRYDCPNYALGSQQSPVTDKIQVVEPRSANPDTALSDSIIRTPQTSAVIASARKSSEADDMSKRKRHNFLVEGGKNIQKHKQTQQDPNIKLEDATNQQSSSMQPSIEQYVPFSNASTDYSSEVNDLREKPSTRRTRRSHLESFESESDENKIDAKIPTHQKTFLSKLLEEIASMDEAYEFTHPVVFSEMMIPDYPEVIAKPMDLSIMQEKLSNNAYSNVDALRADFDLMVGNAQTWFDHDYLTTRNTQIIHIPQFGRIKKAKFDTSILKMPEDDPKGRKNKPTVGSSQNKSGQPGDGDGILLTISNPDEDAHRSKTTRKRAHKDDDKASIVNRASQAPEEEASNFDLSDNRPKTPDTSAGSIDYCRRAPRRDCRNRNRRRTLFDCNGYEIWE